MSNACNSTNFQQMLMRWGKKAASAMHPSCVLGAANMVPPVVPAGHLAVYVGESHKRVVIPLSYLSYPAFRDLLGEAEEKYGYDHKGPITLPCDELRFEEIHRLVAAYEKAKKAPSSKVVSMV